MATYTYKENPALRPTVLVNAVMTTVYRPTPPRSNPTREVPVVRPDATAPVARPTTTRAA